MEESQISFGMIHMKKWDYLWIGCLVLLDQWSKWLVAGKLALYESITVIPRFFYITYAKNTGAAFSILEGKMEFFYLITLVALGFMIFYFRKVSSKHVLMRAVFVLLIAGTLGNFIDRLVLHYVRDFFHFIIFGYDFAIFNVADIALSCGVALMILDALLEERKMRR